MNILVDSLVCSAKGPNLSMSRVNPLFSEELRETGVFSTLMQIHRE